MPCSAGLGVGGAEGGEGARSTPMGLGSIGQTTEHREFHTMPNSDTRRILKEFGIAVTTFDEVVDQGASMEDVANAETEMLARLDEVRGLVEQLQARKK